MSQSGQQPAWSSRYNPLDHRACALAGAISLFAGKQISISPLAYPVGSPSRLARAIQLGNSFWGLLRTLGRDRIGITGETIAWRSGELQYFPNPVFKQWRGSSNSKQPLFVVPGTQPEASIAAFLGCDPDPAPRLYLSYVNCSLVIMGNWAGAPAVLHYGTCSRSIADVGEQVGGLQIAESDTELAPLLPRLLSHKTLSNGAVLSVQTRIPADPWQFSWRRIDLANELWLSRKLTGSAESVDELAHRLELVCEYSPNYKPLLAPLANALLEWYQSVQLPGGVVHGDFSLGNVLFRGDTITGIIDWDHVRKNGSPLVDALFMIVNTYSGSHKIPPGNLFRQLFAGAFEDPAVAERIGTVRSESGMDADELKFLALMLWFDFLLDRAKEWAWQPDSWVDDMIAHTAPVLTSWLKRRQKT